MRSRPRFHALVVAIVVIAAVLQTVVLARIGLPGGNPDLVLLVVIAVGLATSPNYGAVVGFGAGLLTDILPPDLTTLGTTSMVFAVVGYSAGKVRDPRGLAPAQLFGLIGGLTLLASVAQLLLAWLLADRALDVSPAAGTVLAYSSYTTVLGMILVPLTVRGLRRISGGPKTRRHATYDRPRSPLPGSGSS